MSSNRLGFGALALWATLCVVLLACACRVAAPAQPEGPVLVAASSLTAVVEHMPTLPSAPAPESPAADLPAPAETGSDTDTSAAVAFGRLQRAAWVAVIPPWPATAPCCHRLEPSLRLNPGHAPPRA